MSFPIPSGSPRPVADYTSNAVGVVVATSIPDQMRSAVIAGAVLDQAALHGLLTKIHNFGLPLISVQRIEPPP